ncbi:MAG TPA: YraN family protein [Gammaproteobacteria bacterium]|nr:YraN family protein [Gammaproteobacteria bacterium]
MKSTLERTTTTTRIGQRGEQIAGNHLQSRGLQILHRNFRSRAGEIDLIARDADEIVFVEVRLRKSNRFGSAAESVGHQKQQRIRTTAQVYLQQYRQIDTACRFDVVAITGTPDHYQLEWIRDAF